jgi:predicted RNase H-like HicB family nuclease
MGMHRYLVVIEPTVTGFSAFSPDVPGCVATATTRDEAEARMREALTLHLETLRDEGEAVPEPAASAAYVRVGA